MNRLFAALCRTTDPAADCELVARFTTARDEAAFAEIVRRYGPAVWAACRRHLPPPDAEDAFQATFLVLVRRANALTSHPAIGPWLHRVAVLTARNLARGNRRRTVQFALLPADVPVSVPLPAHDLDDALLALPDRLRVPVTLCHLLGLTRREAVARKGRSRPSSPRRCGGCGSNSAATRRCFSPWRVRQPFRSNWPQRPGGRR